MIQLNSSKYSVAWYKLSELVIKKEKERALGILRLLVHSLNDNAFAAQLEGDLLLSFQDLRAIESYLKSAQLYEKSSRFIEAVAIYENLLTIAPDSIDYVQKLLALYQVLGNENKILVSWISLLEILFKKNRIKEIDQLCSNAHMFFSRAEIVHQYIVLGFIKNGIIDRKNLNYHIKMAIEYFSDNENIGLNQFIARLAALDKESHDYAYDLVKKMDYKKKRA